MALPWNKGKKFIWFVQRVGTHACSGPFDRAGSDHLGTYATKDEAKAVARLLRHYGHRAEISSQKVDEDFVLHPIARDAFPLGE